MLEVLDFSYLLSYIYDVRYKRIKKNMMLEIPYPISHIPYPISHIQKSFIKVEMSDYGNC
jgi:hypothetical protein